MYFRRKILTLFVIIICILMFSGCDLDNEQITVVFDDYGVHGIDLSDDANNHSRITISLLKFTGISTPSISIDRDTFQYIQVSRPMD